MRNSKIRFIDLSQPLFNGIPLAGPLPRFQSHIYLSLEDGDTCNCYSSVLSDHTGTHCDAPFHVLPGGKTLDSILLTPVRGQRYVLMSRNTTGRRSPLRP